MRRSQVAVIWSEILAKQRRSSTLETFETARLGSFWRCEERTEWKTAPAATKRCSWDSAWGPGWFLWFLGWFLGWFLDFGLQLDRLRVRGESTCECEVCLVWSGGWGCQGWSRGRSLKHAFEADNRVGKLLKFRPVVPTLFPTSNGPMVFQSLSNMF